MSLRYGEHLRLRRLADDADLLARRADEAGDDHGHDRIANVLDERLFHVALELGRRLAERVEVVDQRRRDLAVGPHRHDHRQLRIAPDDDVDDVGADRCDSCSRHRRALRARADRRLSLHSLPEERDGHGCESAHPASHPRFSAVGPLQMLIHAVSTCTGMGPARNGRESYQHAGKGPRPVPDPWAKHSPCQFAGGCREARQNGPSIVSDAGTIVRDFLSTLLLGRRPTNVIFVARYNDATQWQR